MARAARPRSAQAPLDGLDSWPDATTSSQSFMNRVAGDGASHFLFVVNFTKDRTDLARHLVHTSRNVPQSRVRLLLLARSAGDWWKDLSRELRALCNLMDPYPLPPVDDSIQRRKAAYDDAVRDLAAGSSRSP